MLRHLSVHNYALVKTLDIEFSAGLSVITGESGAGKSILLGALGLVLGERADSKAVRYGANKTEVSAELDLSDKPQAVKFLSSRDLTDPDEPARCLLRRVITADGRSRAFINGSVVNLKDLKVLTNSLINIHGQDQHMDLLQKEVQLSLLDEYGVDPKLNKKVRALYQQWQSCKKRCSDLRQTLSANKDRQALISYQVEELNVLGINPGEYEEIDAQHRRFAKVHDLQHEMGALLTLLSDDSHSILDQLRKLNIGLNDVDDPDVRLDSAKDLARNALTFLDEAQGELSAYTEQLMPDPEQLAILEKRLVTISDLSRKHRVRPEKLVDLHASLITELQNISINEDDLIRLTQAETDTKKQFIKQATSLRKTRKQASKGFSSAVSTHIQHLGMVEGALEITFHEQISETGLDAIEFKVKTNPKYPAATLARIASGGERTRIGLAIQVVAAEKTQLPTLVLDEADVGVGGKTSDILGRLLRDLAKNTQVLCVTHAPQVAALGHQHLVVTKTASQDSTISTLSPSARVEELARMLGGKDITAKTRQYAEELISMKETSNETA